MRNRIVTAAAVAFVCTALLGSCADEDGDGATTDEELQDVRDRADDVEQEVREEVDGQSEGSNDNSG